MTINLRDSMWQSIISTWLKDKPTTVQCDPRQYSHSVTHDSTVWPDCLEQNFAEMDKNRNFANSGSDFMGPSFKWMHKYFVHILYHRQKAASKTILLINF